MVLNVITMALAAIAVALLIQGLLGIASAKASIALHQDIARVDELMDDIHAWAALVVQDDLKKWWQSEFDRLGLDQYDPNLVDHYEYLAAHYALYLYASEELLREEIIRLGLRKEYLAALLAAMKERTEYMARTRSELVDSGFRVDEFDKMFSK